MRWLVLALIVVAALAVLRGRALRRRRWAAEDAAFAAAHEGFDMFVSRVDRSVIAVRPETRELSLGKVGDWRRHSFDDITSVEILRDGDIVAQASRARPPPEASSEPPLAPQPPPRHRRAYLRSLEIEILLDDGTAPVRLVEFLRSSSARGADAARPRARAAIDAAERFRAALFSALRTRRKLSELPLASSPAFARMREISEERELEDGPEA